MQDARDPHYHQRPIAGCELEIADDISLAGATLREGARGATLFCRDLPSIGRVGITLG